VRLVLGKELAVNGCLEKVGKFSTRVGQLLTCLLQLNVLGPGFLQDGDVGVGITFTNSDFEKLLSEKVQA
jgi:hypothetical protein